MLTEVVPLEHGVVSHEISSCGRAHHLSAMRRRHQARRPVHGAPVVVAVAQLHFARMQPYTRLEWSSRAPRLSVQADLRRTRRGNRVSCGREYGMEAVTSALDHMAAMRLDRAAHDLVVTRQRSLHRPRM